VTPARLSPRRVLVALEASPPGLGALSEAATLASRLGAHLEGLLVEDPDVLRAASFPAAHQLAAPSGTVRPVDREAVEAELRAIVARAREALASAVRPLGLPWSFTVARGEPWREVVRATHHNDLVVLLDQGTSTHSSAMPPRVAALARGSVLVLRRGAPLGPHLCVVHDGSQAADRALELAISLGGRGARLALLVLARTREEARSIAAGAHLRHGRSEEMPATWAGGLGPDRLLRAAHRHAALLVMAAEWFELDRPRLAQILEATKGALLLVS